MGVGLGEMVAGSTRMASKLRGVGLGFARFDSARTWVVARKGRRKMGMLERSILNVVFGIVCSVLPSVANAPGAHRLFRPTRSLYIDETNPLC